MIKRIIVLLAGIACIVIGAFCLSSHFKAQKTQTAETVATIIRIDSEVETDSDGFDTRQYYPVIQYNVNGQRYEIRLPDSGTTNSTEYKEGDTATIKYNPNNPNEISKKDSKGGLLAGIFFIVFGVITLVASIFRRF